VASAGRGLGRGLLALVDPDATGPGLVELSVDRIVANSRQPRTAFETEPLEGLARSIAADGVLQPVVVRDRGDGSYELIAGERRLRAARHAGLATVPAIVRRADDREALLLALVENVAREDLNAVDEARAYAALVDTFELSAAEVATRVGKSRPAVANTLRLLDLPDEVLDHVAAGRLSEGHGRALLQAEGHDAQRRLARRAVAESWSVRRTEAAAREATPRTRRGGRAAAGPDWADDDLRNDLTDALFRATGRPVRIQPDGAGVRIELRLASPEEAAALLARLP
jgi:ParB family chromosome partitioning protein